MKMTKILSGIAASAVALSAMATCAFAGADGEAYIMFADASWLAQYWDDGKEYATTANNAVIDGNGTYTISVTAAASIENEDTGEMEIVEGATGLAFAAIGVANGEKFLPTGETDADGNPTYHQITLTVDSVVVDGVEATLNGTPYTASDDAIVTRANLYNSWVSNAFDVADARTAEGTNADGAMAADATPVALDLTEFEDGWTTMEVTFTVSGYPEGAASDDAGSDATVDTDAGSTDADKGSADTGVEGVAAVAGLAVVAAGAVVLSKKRK